MIQHDHLRAVESLILTGEDIGVRTSAYDVYGEFFIGTAPRCEGWFFSWRRQRVSVDGSGPDDSTENPTDYRAYL